jgi:hypothetical protein
MRYSAPVAALGRTLTVRESGAEVVLLSGSEEVARHRKLTGAEGHSQSTLPGHERRGRRPRAVLPEEQRLKELGGVMPDYLARLKAERGCRYFWSVRRLYGILCQHRAEDFLRAVVRASEHGLYDVRRIEGILLGDLARQEYLLPMETQEYECSAEYQKGASAPASDLSLYGLETGTVEEGRAD